MDIIHGALKYYFLKWKEYILACDLIYKITLKTRKRKEKEKGKVCLIKEDYVANFKKETN